MKLNTLSIIAVLLCLSGINVHSQNTNRFDAGQQIPTGVVVYSLPSTTFRIEAETLCETFVPGPYADYAKKYLGIDVSKKEYTEYSLRGINLKPYIEADQSCSFIADLAGFKEKAAPASFLQFSSQGLIVFSDTNIGADSKWRFPSPAGEAHNNLAEATENLTSTETTLYRTEKNADGVYDKIAIKQSSVITKNMETKAKEAAEMIFSIREQRFNIVTGNTDATFSGDALRAAIEELTRMEKEYMELFTGSCYTSVQKTHFDVVPNTSKEEMTIAFRLSGSLGLLPADDISGDPIVMEISAENPDMAPTDIAQLVTEAENARLTKSKQEANSRGCIYYRVPSVCKVKISNGTRLLLQTRMPVYQKGSILTFPLGIMVK